MALEELDDVARWVTWRLIAGKKPPVDANGKALRAWRDPANWVTRAEATARLAVLTAPAGVGFVLGDGWGGVDLDDCRNVDTGELDPRAGAVLDLCEGAYAEVSPSGKGIKIFGRAERWIELTFRPDTVQIQSRTAGYFCVTGDQIGNAAVGLPSLPLDTIESFFGRDPGQPVAATQRLPDVIRPGSQNQELFKEACRQVRDGKTEAEVLAIVRAVAEQRCPPAPGSPPWTDADFRAIARSASRYKPAEDPFPRTESGDAEFFARLHADCVRYDHPRKRWLKYDGTRWAPQEAGEVERLALETFRARAVAAVRSGDTAQRADWKEALKWAISGESAARRGHLLDLARREPPIADAGTSWDDSPWLLGVPNGVVDLRTGDVLAGDPADRITMQARVAYDPDAECPLWLATVEDVFRDNPDLVPYVQRALGYSITGDCREEIFFILTGTGRNGKGTLINTVAWVLGDYAADLAFHSLERGRDGDKTTNDVAKLVGRRFITASESSGSRFNESRIKQMTGRDPITCRFLYQEEFTFIPAFKLWLSVNHLPKVYDDSEGFWSRPHRVPFLQSYLGRENRELKDQLRDEAAGILAWLVRGCLAWQAEGLTAPAVVREAVEEYREGQEPVAEFFTDCCVLDQTASASGAELRAAYVRWCDQRRVYGERRLGPQRFAASLVKKTGEPQRTRTGVRYFGIGLAASEFQEQLDLGEREPGSDDGTPF